MFIEHLGGGQVEILLRDMDSSLSQSIHSGFGAHTFQFGTGAAIHLFGDFKEVDSTC